MNLCKSRLLAAAQQDLNERLEKEASEVEARHAATVEQTRIAHEVALHALASNSGDAWEKVYDDENLYVLGSQDELIQVFSNIIENSIKYANENSKIRIQLRILMRI